MLLYASLACSGDDPTTPDSGAPPANPLTTTSPTVGDDATPTDTGWACNPWYPCQDCGGTWCGPEIGACAADGACGGALNQWAQCVLDCGDPRVCADTFAAEGGARAGEL